MKLAYAIANALVDDLAARLAGGALRIFEGAPPRASLQQPLVSIPLGAVPFTPATTGRAISEELPAAVIDMSGEAGWAELVAADEATVATLVVRARDAEDVRSADLVLDRVDFQRGGICQIDRLTLQLPVSPEP